MPASSDKSSLERDALPSRGEYYAAIVAFLKERKSASIAELDAGVAQKLKLSPAAMSARHDGRRSTFQYAMAWARTELKWASLAVNRPRGVWRLTRQGLSATERELLELGSKGGRGPQTINSGPAPPPVLPKQGPGPHFTLQDGILAFAEGVDGSGNDLKRLRSLKPIVQETASQLVSSLARHEGLWPDLERAARDYETLLRGDTEHLDYGRLFGQGIILANATKIAKTPDVRGNAYELVPECALLADSLLQMHGPLLLGTPEGQALVLDAERFQSTSEQQAKFRETEVDLSLAISGSPSLAAPEVKLHISDVVSLAEGSERPDHVHSYMSAMVRNASLIIVGGLTVSTAALLFATGTAVPVASIAAGIFGGEALKKSRPGQSITNGLAHLIDKATVDFVVRNETLFRQLAKRPSMQWLDSALTWSLSQNPRIADDSVPDGELLDPIQSSIAAAVGETLSLQLLGNPVLRLPDGSAVKLRGKAYALAAVLCLEFPNRARRSTLAEKVWEDSSAEQAMTNLRQTLLHTRDLESRHEFRLFETDTSGIELSRDLVIDLREIGRIRAATDGADLEALIDLYRGELLAGVDGFGREFSQWLSLERTRTENQFTTQATEAALRIGGRAGHSALHKLAERLPYSDVVCRATIELFRAEDNEAAARAAFAAFRHRLRQGLGLEPAAETAAMMER